MKRGKYKRKENNWKIKDDVYINSLWGFDYCFCRGDCGNIHCGRNKQSDSYRVMVESAKRNKHECLYSCSDFTKSCRAWRKPKSGNI